MKFPDYYRQYRHILVAIANLLIFWPKGRNILSAVIKAFDTALLNKPYAGASPLDENIRLGDIIVYL